MFDVRQTAAFRDWLSGLADRRGAKRIAIRIARLQSGLFGDAKSVGGRVSELRIDSGPGYRVYFVQQGRTVIVLLCGGDKGSQARDIRRAQTMAKDLKESGFDD